MLKKNNKINFKTQALLMTMGTLAPMAPALVSNVGNVIAHADTMAPAPIPQRLSTPSNENLQMTPFTWTIKVVNQQNNQTIKSDNVTFTPVNNKTGNDGGTTVTYNVKDTAGIFNKNNVQIDNGDIDFNKILSNVANGNVIRGGKGTDTNVASGNDALSNWVFGKTNSNSTPAYILPELNNRDGQATQSAQVSGSDDHKVLTFYVIPNTAQTKNANTNNNAGNTTVDASNVDTGNNTATSTKNNGSSTTSNNVKSNNGNHNTSTATTTSNQSKSTNSSAQQSDADAQQIINAINQHTVNSNDKLPSDAKLLEQAPANTNGFNAYSVQVAKKGANGQITYSHLTVHYNPATKQFYVTNQGSNTALTKAQLLQLFGLQSKAGQATTGTNGANGGTATSGNLGGGTTNGSTGNLAQTNATTKQNGTILLATILGTATLGLALTKDNKLKLN